MRVFRENEFSEKRRGSKLEPRELTCKNRIRKLIYHPVGCYITEIWQKA